MKNILILMLGATFFQSCIIVKTDKEGTYSTYDQSQNGEDYSTKPMESHDFFVTKFSEINAQSGMKFYIKKSNQQKVVVNSNAPCLVVVSSKSGALNIEYDNKNGSLNNVKTEVTVYTPDFDKLNVSSAGQISIEDEFQLDKLNINLNSAGKVIGNIFANKLAAHLSSASTLEANIQSKIVNLEVSSAAKANLRGSAEQIKINASSVAKVNLENLKYKIIEQETNSLAKIYTK